MSHNEKLVRTWQSFTVNTDPGTLIHIAIELGRVGLGRFDGGAFSLTDTGRALSAQLFNQDAEAAYRKALTA